MPSYVRPLYRPGSNQEQLELERRQQRIERAPVPYSARVKVTVEPEPEPEDEKKKKRRPDELQPISSITYLSYAGHLYRFRASGLTPIGTSLAEDLSRSRSLRINKGTYYWAAADPDSGDVFLYHSPNGKTVVGFPPPIEDAVLVDFDVAKSGRVWAIWSIGSDCAVMYSDDKGETWTLSLTLSGDGTDNENRIACSPGNTDHVALTSINSDTDVITLRSTSDGGDNWGSASVAQAANSGGNGPISPSYHLKFLGDLLLLVYQGDLHKLSSVRTNVSLSPLTETLLIDDAGTPSGIFPWYGAVSDPRNPDVLVFFGDDNTAVRWIWRSLDGGLTVEQFAYPVGLDGPSGLFFQGGHLYLVVITDVNETSFYRITSVATSEDMALELLFVTTDDEADPETTNENMVAVQVFS